MIHLEGRLWWERRHRIRTRVTVCGTAGSLQSKLFHLGNCVCWGQHLCYPLQQASAEIICSTFCQGEGEHCLRSHFFKLTVISVYILGSGGGRLMDICVGFLVHTSHRGLRWPSWSWHEQLVCTGEVWSSHPEDSTPHRDALRVPLLCFLFLHWCDLVPYFNTSSLLGSSH